MEGNQGETQLFLLRLWLEEPPRAEGEGGGFEEEGLEPHNYLPLRWRGKVQHVVRGEAHAFTGWEMMISYLELMLHHGLAEAAKAKSKDVEGQE